MDDAGPQSLFVVLYYWEMDPQYYSMLQIDHEYVAQLIPEPIIKTEVDQKVLFNRSEKPPKPSTINWLFCPPTSSTEDLYMVPNWGFQEWPTVKPLRGYKFSFTTGRFLQIDPPSSSKPRGHVVNLKGRIYLLAHDWCFEKLSVFQRYDPDKNSWDAPEPFPALNVRLGPIVATAVWGDTILFNVDSCYFWAYNVSRNKWYPVDVEDNLCLSIVEEAVVLGSTIYAFSNLSYDSVLALSIEKDEIDGDLVFKCSLLSEINLVPVPGTEPISFEMGAAWMRTRHLVHLGKDNFKDNFCIVESCIPFENKCYQTIQLTYIKLLKGENSMIVMNKCVHKMKIQHTGSFVLTLCFSLPEYKTTAFKDGKSFVFNFNPYAEEDYASNPVQEEEIVTPVHGDGRSIYVRNLPHNATIKLVEKGLKKFGPIKRDGIKVGKNTKGKCFAFVEFESATSKQRAIKASTIKIGGCPAVMLEKRLTGLALVDYNRTQAVGSSSSGKNKLKNHGEVSRSKTTAVDTMEERGV